jgi:hypothetical protein
MDLQKTLIKAVHFGLHPSEILSKYGHLYY